MRLYKKRYCWMLFLLVFVTEIVSAQAFPFRAVRKGTPLPAVSVEDLTGKPVALNSLKTGVAVILFFGADSRIKKKHAVRALKEVPPALKDVGDKVTFMAIDVLGDSPDVIKEIAEQADFDGPLYVDANKEAYKAFGIFVMPSVLIAKDGKVEAGYGYTHNLADMVKGEVEILLGLKTREAVEAALHPKTAEKSAGEKEALRYCNLGESMLKKRMIPQAEDAFKKALASKGNYVPALLGLTRIALEKGDIAQAETYVKKAETVSPNDLATVLVAARVLAAQKKVDEALSKVLPLALTHPRSQEVNEVLGRLYEQKGDLAKALKYYKKALSLCRRGE
ncbi:MAG: hypothetical protein DRP97_05435 [Candidatus Latescibacterota bacterium]|nr:MAG: hypothetical protein DRP97_05435 [Candidatus Latescibacterota bacterium]